MARKKPWHAPSLSEVLADVKLTHEPAENGHHILDNGVRVFTGTAGEIWNWLREEGHHASMCRECSREHTDVELDINGVCEECFDHIAKSGRPDPHEYDEHGDWLRSMRRADADYYNSGENWRGE